MRQSLKPLLIVGADQLVKSWWGGGVVNRGIALGVLPSDWWFVAVAGVVSYLWLTKQGWGWNLIIGGGVSNLIDRLVRGGVIDGWGIRGLPRFNLADVAIITGSLWLVIARK